MYHHFGVLLICQLGNSTGKIFCLKQGSGKFFGGGSMGLELRASHLEADALPLEPLYQPCFVLSFFEIRPQELFALGWFQTMILLIFAC
jgi:hypothetical protein